METAGHPSDLADWHDEAKVARYLGRIGRSQPRLAGEDVLAELLPGHVERVLDLPHAVSDGAGHEPQFARGAGEAAGAGDCLQQGEGVGREDFAGSGHGSKPSNSQTRSSRSEHGEHGNHLNFSVNSVLAPWPPCLGVHFSFEFFE